MNKVIKFSFVTMLHSLIYFNVDVEDTSGIKYLLQGAYERKLVLPPSKWLDLFKKKVRPVMRGNERVRDGFLY